MTAPAEVLLDAADVAVVVDGAALRSGAWVLLEERGAVRCHGIGNAECPPALAAAILTKAIAPVRREVRWVRSTGPARGRLGTWPVHVESIGDGQAVWFVGAVPDGIADIVRSVRAATGRHTAAPFDAVAEEMLHPRGPVRPGTAPGAVLLLVRGDLPDAELHRAAVRSTVDITARVHALPDAVLVALPSEHDVEAYLRGLHRADHRCVVGVARVPSGASDWVETARLADRCQRAAAAHGLALGTPEDPLVVAAVVVRRAQEAVAEIAHLLPGSPVERLREHDRAHATDLLATVRAWCRSASDTVEAARVLHIHVNTLRYRLRKAAQVSGLSLRPCDLPLLRLLVDAET